MTEAVRAIRRSVAISRLDHPVLRFDVEAGLAELDPILATNLQLREAQFRQTLRLDAAGRPIADALVGIFRGSLYALVDGPLDGPAHPCAVFGIDGPFAWELLANWDTPAAVGLPYLGAYEPRDGVLVVRAGRTGEYGYLLLVPEAEADATWSALNRCAEELDGAMADRDALAHCALENWVFDLHTASGGDLDALELQLTWRLDLDKQAEGLDAIRAHRAAGLKRRIAALVTDNPVTDGATVTHGDEAIGTVVASAPDLLGDGGQRVLAALQTRWSHPRMTYGIEGTAARTISAPFVLNRSLFVNPQRHSWATRDEIELPPELLWPGTTSW